MRITFAVAPVLVALGWVPSLAFAQRVPFFNAGATAFDPEISVVNSGEVLDAQPVVSGDLKHVTINTRASSSRLQALRDFTFVGAGVRRGLVGGAGGGNGGGGGGGGDAANGAPARGRGRGDAAGGRRERRRRDVLDDDDEAADRASDALRAGGAGVLDRPGMTLVRRFED